MKNLTILLILSLFLSGCATINSTYENPDYIRCPHCFSFLIAPPNHSDILQCLVCKNTFTYADGKKLYNLYVEEYNKTVLPAQIISEEQANQGTLNRIHDVYQRSADRQQQNMQTFQKSIADWNTNWQKYHNK